VADARSCRGHYLIWRPWKASARCGDALPRLAVEALVTLRSPRIEQRAELEPIAALVELRIRDEDGGAVARRLDEHPSVRVGVNDDP
jgi:hypothetical protein